eukprot:scaffold83566_cov27-Phaeocystis_antarctica.AAC.1
MGPMATAGPQGRVEAKQPGQILGQMGPVGIPVLSRRRDPDPRMTRDREGTRWCDSRPPGGVVDRG